MSIESLAQRDTNVNGEMNKYKGAEIFKWRYPKSRRRVGVMYKLL